MNFDTSWDVGKYQDNYESERFWQWKREFLIKNKNKVQENYLVNLADMFLKFKFLKWQYPEIIMDLLREYSDGLEENDDDWQNNSDNVPAIPSKRLRLNTSINNKRLCVKNNKNMTPYHSDYILPGFILVLGITEDPLEILDRACAFSNMSRPFIKFCNSLKRNRIYAYLYIKNILIASTFGESRSDARKSVSKDAYNKLKQYCFAIKIKEDKIPINRINVNVEVNVCFKDDSGLSQNLKVSIPIGDALAIFHNKKYERNINNDNIGKKLLKMMGWQDGSGLGKENQGRLEPIEAIHFPNNRRGLGYVENRCNSNYICQSFYSFSICQPIELVLKNAISQQIEDFKKGPGWVLSFATQCTTEERRLIHLICKEFDLITRSYGNPTKRSVVVFKKENSQELFKKLINKNLDDYFELIFPEKFK